MQTHIYYHPKKENDLEISWKLLYCSFLRGNEGQGVERS